MRPSIRNLIAAVLGCTVLSAQDWDAYLAEELDAKTFFTIVSYEATAADVKLTEDVLLRAIVQLRASFGSERVTRLLQGIECKVHVHGKANERVNDGYASISTNAGNDGYVASIEILGPSGSKASFRSAAGQGPGPEHFSKVLVHEYVAILLDRITRSKQAGWRFHSAPRWFVQGYEEYLGATMSRPGNRDTVLSSYLARQRDPDRIRFHPKFTTADPCVDGTVLMHFLHEEFGGERVRAVLDCPRATFDEALTRTLGASMVQIEARWKSWLDTALKSMDWQVRLHAATSPSEIAAAVVGKNLRQLPGKNRERVVDALRILTGKDTYWREPSDGQPQLLIGVGDQPASRALIVTGRGWSVPGVSWLAVHRFDKDWQQTTVQSFPTGYRMALFDAWQERVAALPDPAIVVRLGSIGSFGDFTYRQLQYYAFQGSRVALVRIEEEGKGITRGSFAASRPWTGPPPIQRTKEQWIETLASERATDVLETLTWLGGGHMAPDKPRTPSVNEESVVDARLWASVRDDARTKAKLAELSKSENRWIREAAVLAVQPPRDR